MSLRFTSLFAAAAALTVFLTSCSTSQKAEAPRERKAAPEFTLADQTGKQVKLSDFKGKVVLLNFWATWCGPCKVEIPWFIEFQKTYENKDLVILGVSLDEDGWTSVKPYMDEKKMNYRVLAGNDDVAKNYGGVESLPTTFLIDKEGRIAATHVGLISKSAYKKEIEGLLDGKEVGKNDSKPTASADAAISGSGTIARAN